MILIFELNLSKITLLDTRNFLLSLKAQTLFELCGHYNKFETVSMLLMQLKPRTFYYKIIGKVAHLDTNKGQILHKELYNTATIFFVVSYSPTNYWKYFV